MENLQPMPDVLADRQYVVVDTETSGKDEGSELLEVAALRFQGGAVVDRYASLVRPTRPVPAGAIAVHWLTADKLADAPPRAVVDGWLQDFVRPDDYVVAHHGVFDRERLPCLADRRWICSCRLARHLWPHAPAGHSNQGLAAWLRLDRWIAEGGRAHRAEHDAMLTGLLFWRQLQAYQGLHPYAELADVGEYAASPIDVQSLRFGKYAGTRIADIPVAYLEWILADQQQPTERRYLKDLDRDTLATVERHVRERGRRAA